jgi:hypothetical protein
MQAVDTFTHHGIDCAIYQDEDAGNPYVEWDQASRLLLGPALARQYDFGQEPRESRYGSGGIGRVETFYRLEDFSSLAAAARDLRLMEGYAVVIPFRFEDYGSSGAKVYATDEPDDRAAGFVVVDHETVAREWDGDLDAAERCARGELETFGQYVAGDVYGYVIADDSPEYDSCWGFYGDGHAYADGTAWHEAREAAAHAATRRAERLRMQRVYLLDPDAIEVAS